MLAYPNPFNSAFQLDLKSTHDDKIEMKVYDMVGKLVEARKFDAADLNNQNVGSNYTSGIYNVILSQGKSVKTVRLIKK